MKKYLLFLICFTLIVSDLIYAADAPVTRATTVTNAIPGTSPIVIPVSVTGFTDIGKLTLTMTFDTTKVRFISAVSNPLLTGMTITYTPVSGSKKGKLVFSWTGAASTNMSLPDSSVLASLNFSYVNGTGILYWSYSSGYVCKYQRYVSGVLTTLTDDPKYLFYKNGGIANRGAPITHAPELMPTGPGPLPVPVKVDNFTDIGALTLYLEYNPAIMTYQNTFTKNPAFGSSFVVGSVPGTGGNMMIVIQWFGNTGITLPNGSTLCTLNFNYTLTSGTTCTLNWFDNGPSCEYADGPGYVLADQPTPTFYTNGNVSLILIPNFIADNLTPPKNTTVTFTDLSLSNATAWNWSFSRPDVVFVNGTSATSKNPQVQFTDGGLFGVKLVVQNGYLTDSIEKTAYIRAGLPGIWTGNISSDWSLPANWDNYDLPAETTAVIIPPAAPNWPVFDGDLTIGVHCATLTLSGSTSEMTVTGNLVIP